ncbi:MAG: CocE/NonD family hydrolase, partial [Actinomycetota bacterium]
MSSRHVATFVAASLLVAACSSDGGDSTTDDASDSATASEPDTGADLDGEDGSVVSDDEGVSDPSTTTDEATSDESADDEMPDDADPGANDAVERTGFDGEVRPGTEQLALIGDRPGRQVELLAVGHDDDRIETTDEFGSLLFRDLAAGETYRLLDPDDEQVGDGDFVIAGRDDHPEPAFYAEQRLPAPGFGYVETRDGTTLSVNVVLPGAVEDGPYPTVVEYSGYTPSDPESTGFGDLFSSLGYAYVGVNMRGTGCSGGSFRYFEYVQSLDGYDVIEAVAAQPWVQANRVGMVGVSYPGISQLFVAQTQPPSLA